MRLNLVLAACVVMVMAVTVNIQKVIHQKRTIMENMILETVLRKHGVINLSYMVRECQRLKNVVFAMPIKMDLHH